MYPLETWFVLRMCVWMPCIKETMLMVIIIIIIILANNTRNRFYPDSLFIADPSDRAVKGVGLLSLACWVQIPPGEWMSVCCECRVLSGRGLCDELIPRPEESYRVWCVVVCDQETSKIRRASLDRSGTGKMLFFTTPIEDFLSICFFFPNSIMERTYFDQRSKSR